MKFAEALFDVSMKYQQMEDELLDRALEWCGTSSEAETWPFDDVTFDWYDASFELKGALPGTVLTPAGHEAAAEAGFLRYWICYVGGKEHYWSIRRNRT